ncbi:DNA excision repair protein ERCC-6-like [Sorex fumeus]|uniref:DNA excision repair protein ERCC-6-like n=1 Tax=Sorex fumeus TaxID=62283 RepID=UPI0024ACA6FC|nr:DNA excision repair protein ERCC-6-like [Sorex fumeus]
MEASGRLAGAEDLSSEQAAHYLRYVKEAKEAAKNGDLQEAFKLFSLAKDIFPSAKVMSRIQKIQEALEELAENGSDEFTDVCNSGLLLYRELHDQLFEHQKEGVAFLYSLYRDGRKGGILADDMGLGKTVQIIAFLSGMFDASLVNHVLLIIPTSLISTWIKEFVKWTPGMRVKTFHGPSKDERSRNLSRVQQRNGVIITTYQVLINNWQQLSRFNGHEFVWDYIILDEAHKIKTSSTKSAVCARLIPASNRILLTGTPVQNNLQELWSLFDFACQGSLLGTSRTFKMEYENPITRARQKDATPGEKALGFKISENLMTIIKPYFLRRTKEEVQKKTSHNQEVRLSVKNPTSDAICEMPSLSRKNDLIIWIRLVPVQEEIYRKFVSLDHIKELLMETRSPLAELGVLKKLCDHPRLLSARTCHLLNLEAGQFSVDNEREDLPDRGHFSQVTDTTLIEESGKMIFLMDLLKRLRDEGHQTLLFSQSRQILNIIERLLRNRHFKTLRIDGTISHLVERERRIDLFQKNKDYSVFLLTTQVGGVGLTLTAASRVVIFDPSWNPATDAQAVDRVYRIGQKENVVVYRLITCGTVEEKIYRRQIFKDSIVRQTTGDKKNPFRYFSKQELRELFTVEDFQTSATQLQLQTLHATQRRSDKKLDDHIAFLYSLGIAGISDHDLMFIHDTSVKEELDMIKDSNYIQKRVQKAQFLVESESQNTELLKERLKSEGTCLVESMFPHIKMKRHHSNIPKPAPSPPITIGETAASPPITIGETEEEEIISQLASVIIDDLPDKSAKEDLTSLKMNVSDLQKTRRTCESTSHGYSAATFYEDCECEEVNRDSVLEIAESFAVESKSLQEEAIGVEVATQEALGVKPLRSDLLRVSVRGDLETNLDQLKDDEILHHCSPWPMNSSTNINQNEELNASVTTKSHDFSAPHSSLQGDLQDVQANEAKLMEKTSAFSLQYACDFNLFLEDSADNRQDFSSRSLLHVKKENSLCGSAAGSRAESVQSTEPLHLNSDDEAEVVVNVKSKRKTRRITSDSEDEGDTSKETVSTNLFSTSPFEFSSAKQFDASTPKTESSSGRFFSPKISDSINKSRSSFASRRSLINVVLDYVEDMEESLDNSEGEAVEDYLEEEEENTGQTPEETETPTRESLPSETKASCLTAPKPDAPAQEPPCGDPEPLCGVQSSDAPQEKAVETADDYESLVKRGKELKECGKIQEALNCLVKALDIKSADPEVMLLTLSLYKQLNKS